MKIKFISLSLLLFALLFAACTKEQIIPEEVNPANAVEAATANDQGDTPEGATCCAVFGAPQQMVYWENDIQSVLNCCYTEDLSELGLNCTYWGTATETVTIEYQFPAYPDFTEGQVNGYLSVMAAAIEDEKVSLPGSNWMVDQIDWVRDYGCPQSYYCYNLNITFRKFICQQVPSRR